jgi:cytoskeletal protein CcmA (bactofilin family)
MLGNKKGGFGVGGNTTLISRDTTIIGDVHFSGSLEVEGVVQGNIIADSGKDALVRVVEKGRVEGEIRAPSVVINGTVEGDVFSTKQLELAPKGRVQGNVHYALLEMAAGSEVNGSLTHSVSAEALREKAPDPSVEVTEVFAAADSGAEASAKAKVD